MSEENNYNDEKYFDDNCIFCKIIKKEIISEIIYEDEYTIAFNDQSPKATIHILVVPKIHVKDITEVDSFFISKITNTIQLLAKDLELKGKGFRVITNCGAGAGQTVWHLHFHMLSGKYKHF